MLAYGGHLIDVINRSGIRVVQVGSPRQLDRVQTCDSCQKDGETTSSTKDRRTCAARGAVDCP